jgi:hypothetical protein
MPLGVCHPPQDQRVINTQPYYLETQMNVFKCLELEQEVGPSRSYRQAYLNGYEDGQAELGFAKTADQASRAAERTLTYMGYTHEGGKYWKPPLGNSLGQAKEWQGLTEDDFERIDPFCTDISMVYEAERILKKKNT